MPDTVLLAQGLALLIFVVQSTAACIFHLPIAVLRCYLSSFRKYRIDEGDEGCTFYEGTVFHKRHKPVQNAFR